MNLKQRIEADLKDAMLRQDKVLVTTLRTLKSALLYAEVASGKREQGLGDDEIVALLRKEAKKRQESAELFAQGGNQAKSDAERQELKVLEAYLPPEMDDETLAGLVDRAFGEIDDHSPQALGKLIAHVKELSSGSVDGGRIAAAVKKRLGV
jgi:uncharacterized protein